MLLMKILSAIFLYFIFTAKTIACGNLEGIYSHCKSLGDKMILNPFAIKIKISQQDGHQLMTKFNYQSFKDFEYGIENQKQEFLLDNIRYEKPSYFPDKLHDFITYSCLDNAFVSKREKIFLLEGKTQFEKVKITRAQEKLIILLEMFSGSEPVAIQKIICSED